MKPVKVLIEELKAVGVGPTLLEAVRNLSEQLQYRENRLCLCGHAHLDRDCPVCGCLHFGLTRDRWIEIPAMRVLIATHQELRADFYETDETGELVSSGVYGGIFVHKVDGECFVISPFQPQDGRGRLEIALVRLGDK